MAGYGWSDYKSTSWGKPGTNPTERAKSGTKRSILVRW